MAITLELQKIIQFCKTFQYSEELLHLEKQKSKSRPFFRIYTVPPLTLNRQGGGGGGRSRPQAVSNRKLKHCDFYYILIGLNSEHKPVPWDIYCCHDNAIVEGCLVKFWLKLVENCNFLLNSFSNFNLGLLFVIRISKLPPIPNFKQIR